MWDKRAIEDRLKGKPHLIPMYTHVYNIPERLRQNDPNLFVVYNSKTGRFEVHSLANIGNSLSLNVPFRELDARTEEFVKKYDLKRHGRKIFREIDERNEEVSRRARKQRSNDIRGLADELHKPVRRLAWGNA